MATMVPEEYGLLELHHPDEATPTKVLIVAVHGINGHHHHTWTAGPGDSKPPSRAETPTAQSGDVNARAKPNKGRNEREKTLSPSPSMDDLEGEVDTPPESLPDATERRTPEPGSKGGKGSLNNAEDGEEENEDGEEDEESEEEDKRCYGTNWLKKFVPQKIPGARVLTYGYDCGTAETPQAVLSTSWIQRVARDLLVALAKDAKLDTVEGLEDQTMLKTPIVFVCHDFGGVITKEMLWIANNERFYLPIAVRTQLLVFFATPHQESECCPWPDIIFDVALASTELNRSNRRHIITSVIKSGPAGVIDVSERFNQLAGQYRVLNFYPMEENDTVGAIVMPKECATMNGPLEEHYSIRANHLAMCLFTETDDSQLELICQKAESVSAKRTQGSLKVRATFSARTPQRNWPILPPTDPATIVWIKSTPSVQTWLQANTFSILHVYGQAGSGKTVFAAFLEKYLQSGASDLGPSAVISYSFDSSSYCGRTFSDMLESLLRELLSQTPSVEAALTNIHSQITERSVWNAEDMCLMFSAAVATFELPILCLIDGIQDCDSSRESMLAYMVNVAKNKDGTPFKLLFTSHISIEEILTKESKSENENTVLVVDLDDQQIVHEERHRIVRKRLNKFVSPKTNPTLAQDLEIVAEKFCKLNMTFLEADLLIKKFEGQPATLASLVNLGHELDSIMEKDRCLPIIYERHLQLKFETATHEELTFVKRVLPWLVYSEEPLTLTQLALAQHLEGDISPFSEVGADSLRSKDIPAIMQHTFGPLVAIEGDKIHFIHATAREYLAKHPQLEVDLTNIAKCHAGIALKCLMYLSSPELDEHESYVETNGTNVARLALPESASGAYDLVTYAAHHWATHFRLATSDDEALLAQFQTFAESEHRCLWWWSLYNYLETDSLISTLPKWVLNTVSQSPFRMACFFGLIGVVKQLLPELTESEELNEGLNVAAWNNHLSVVEETTNYTELPDNVVLNPKEALYSACRVGNVEIAKLLLGHERMMDLDLSLCLTEAAGAGQSKIVELLLESDVDSNAEVEYSKGNTKTALQNAAESGFPTVVKQLLERGADVNKADEDGYTALHFAASNGHIDAVRALLEHPDSDIETGTWAIKPLYLAARGGHLALVKELIKRGADVSAADSSKRTPLHVAASGGYDKIVKVLIDAGADVMAADKDGIMPLHLATASLEAVTLLLENGADPDCACYTQRRRPLHTAAEYGRLAVVNKLIECGASIDPQMHSNKFTPLLLAAYHDAVGCAEALLEAGANPNVKSGPWPTLNSNIGDSTALHLAWGNTSMVKLLLKYNVEEPNVKNEKGHTPFYYATGANSYESCKIFLDLLGSEIDINELDDDGWTPLHNFANRGEIQLMELMVEHGADVNHCNTEGCSSAFIAARAGQREALDWLVKKGAEFLQPDHDGWSPLHVAAAVGQAECVKLLIELGDDPSKPDGRAGWTPLHRAANSGHIAVMQHLLHHGADPLALDLEKWSTLHSAAWGGSVEALSMLLEAGCELEAGDDEEWTALHGTVSGGHAEATKFLIEKGVNVDARTDKGLTPLHCAAMYGKIELLKILLEHGADPNIKDFKGSNLVHSAVSGTVHDQDIVTYLVEIGVDAKEPDNFGRTALFKAASDRDGDLVKQLLEIGLDRDAVDETGRPALDVTFDFDVRRLLGAEDDEEVKDMITCKTVAGGNCARTAYCDVCEGPPRYMEDEFFYHCCDCDNDAFVCCVPCYDAGKRCKNPEEHTMLLRYMGHGMESVEELSPWVKQRTLPRDLMNQGDKK